MTKKKTKMTNNNGRITIALLGQRVEQIEEQLDKMEKTNKDYQKGMNDKMDKLMTNHMPHMEREIIAMKTRINVGTVINVSALIIAIIVARVLQ